jgi:large subunit ribosomal protein L9
MKVILLQDVENLGRTGDVREVSAGYARNYLLRQSLVVEANPSQLKRVEALQARGRKEEERRRRDAMSLAEKLGSLTVTMPVRVGGGGRLFGTVTNADVVAALKSQHGHELDRRNVEIAEAIRSVGPHEATVRLAAQVQATLKLDVVAIES